MRRGSMQNDEALLLSKDVGQCSMEGKAPSSGAVTSSPVIQGQGGRLLVVANRLPVTATKSDGAYRYKMSSGGLVSALMGVRGRLPFVWIGWLGTDIPAEDQAGVRADLASQYGCTPVFLDAQLAEDHYNGFSNDVLWPLLHYESQLGGVIGPAFLGAGGSAAKTFDAKLWGAYKTANKAFAREIVDSVYRPGDCIWVHDYHLMVLPYYLRRLLPTAAPRATIAWFLHTPWPASDIFAVLPVREEIMRGLVAADLLGLHTHDYARHFLSSARRVLAGVQSSPGGLSYHGRSIRVITAPIGIDPASFERVQEQPAFSARIVQLGTFFTGKRLIVAVDRLDPIKGIPHRLLGYEAFLRAHPEWRGKVTLLQVAVPSRIDVPAYAALASACSTLVGRVNAAFGTLDWAPIHYLFKSVEATELTALYSLADVCLITSLRDGMNLVSFEYVACTARPNAFRKAPGVLLLSEFAGSAQSLAGAVRCNPWDTQDVSSAILKSLLMDEDERVRRHSLLHEYVAKYTAAEWALGFVGCMEEVGTSALPAEAEAEAEGPSQTLPLPLPVEEVVQAYGHAQRRMVVLSVEGVLLQLAGAIDHGHRHSLHLIGGGGPGLGGAGKSNLTPGDNREDSGSSPGSDAPVASAQGTAEHASLGTVHSHASTNLPPALASSLRALASDARTLLVLVSSCLGREAMETLFCAVPGAVLIGEGGAVVRLPSPSLSPSRSGAGHRPVGSGTGALRALVTAHPPSPLMSAVRMVSPAHAPLARAPSGTPVHAIRAIQAGLAPKEEWRSRTSTPPPSGHWWATAQCVKGCHPFPVGMEEAQAGTVQAGQGAAGEGLGGGEHPVSSVLRTTGVAAETEKPGAPSLPPPAPLPPATSSAHEQAQAESSHDWQGEVRPLFTHYAVLTPGAVIAESENTLALHFDAAEPEQGAWAAKELLVHLQTSTASVPLEVEVHGLDRAAVWGYTQPPILVRLRVQGTGLSEALCVALSLSPGPPLQCVLGVTDGWDSAGLAPALATLQTQARGGVGVGYVARVGASVGRAQADGVMVGQGLLRRALSEVFVPEAARTPSLDALAVEGETLARASGTVGQDKPDGTHAPTLTGRVQYELTGHDSCVPLLQRLIQTHTTQLDCVHFASCEAL